MKRRNKISFFTLASLSLILGHGCSNVNLLPKTDQASAMTAASVNFCTTPANTIKSALKFIFVVDRSGSNQLVYPKNPATGNYDLPPVAGTDPSGIRRFGAILNFVRSYSSDPNIFWSMVNFSDDVMSGSNFQGFTNQQNSFLSFVNNQYTNTASIDGGDTNYVSTVRFIQKMINDDITAASLVNPAVSSNYVIFFISDGAPIVTGNLQKGSDITSVVSSTAAMQQSNPNYVDGIEFNTGFTGNSDPVASSLLQQMSSNASGTALDFSGGQTIDFSRFSVPTRIAKFVMKEFWVVNQNTIWENGQIVLDSDGDGISDRKELQLGSDPTKVDSDGNGVSDAVELKATGMPCKDSKCAVSGADPFVTCATIVQSTGPKYLDSDGDGLNDCEEHLLGSAPKDFDSNLDYVPDDMALRMGINITGASSLGLDPDFDGLSNYFELKYNTPMLSANNIIPNLQQIQVTSNMVSSTAQQDCYSMNINNIAAVTKFDKIKLYLIENTQSYTQKRVLREANVQMQGGAVSAQDTDFIKVNQ